MPGFLTYISTNPLLGVIAAGEIGFWVLLVAGLAIRYLLRRRTASTVVLLCVPLVDVVILGAAMIDLGRGSAADSTHGLAATYLGFSVAFGHSLVRWADQRFAHRFAGGPRPEKPPKYGAARVRYEWREWAKCAVAWAISCGLLLAMTLFVDPSRGADILWGWMSKLTTVLGIWFALGPLWNTLSPPRDADEQRTDVQVTTRADGGK